jgi:valyl-tRNA synthetase
MKPQWWVDCQPLAEEAVKVCDVPLTQRADDTDPARQRARAGELLITPKSSEAEFFRWMDGMRNWCISRQLWWGHRCPAYFVRISGEDQDVRAPLFLLRKRCASADDGSAVRREVVGCRPYARGG